MMSERIRHTVLLVVACAACAACGGGGGSGAPVCARDEALLAERHECVLNEDCPCGAHCELGLCTSSCSSNDDCDGSAWCDDFGSCRPASDRGPVARTSAAPRTVLRLSETQLTFPPGFREQTLWVSAHSRDSGRIRIAAREGVEVRCARTGDYAPECVIEALVADGASRASIEVRLTASTPPETEEHFDIGLWGEQGIRMAIGVRVLPASTSSLRRANLRHATVGSPVGVYTGFAKPIALTDSEGVEQLPVPEAWQALRLPVTAEVYPPMGDRPHVVVFEDALGALFPAANTYDTAVGELTASGNLSFPAVRYLGPLSPTDAEIAINVTLGSPPSTPLSWNETSLGGTVLARYAGATLPADDPIFAWELTLVRASATAPDGAAPLVPIAVGSRDVDLVAAKELPIEAATLALEGGTLPDLGASPDSRAEALLCTTTTDAASVRLKPTVLDLDPGSATIAAASGDFACADPAAPASAARPQRTFPVLATPTTGPTLPAEELLTTCLDDLDLVDADTTLTSAGCIDGGRVITALSTALSRDRDLARGVAAGSPNLPGSALAQRLLQQWLSLHGAIAADGAKLEDLAAVTGAISTGPEVAALALERSLAGFDLLLHPRVAVGLARTPALVLASPDYRKWLYPGSPASPAATHDQAVGLPAAMLKTLATQAASLNDLVRTARFGRIAPTAIEAPLRELLRRAFVVHGLSAALYRGVAADAGLGWRPEWETAALESGAKLASLLANRQHLVAGDNALGIEEADLPLYRIGDEQSANSRFSALTDYLLGDANDAMALVPTLINQAATSLDAARDAWVASRVRDFSQAHLDAGAGRRLEGVNRQYGEQIITLCGDPTWDSATVLDLPDDDLDPASCFIAAEPGCSPPEIDDSEIFSRIDNADIGNFLCVAYVTRRTFGSTGSATTGDEALDKIVDRIGPDLIADDGRFDLDCTSRVTAPDGSTQLRCVIAGKQEVLPEPAHDPPFALVFDWEEYDVHLELDLPLSELDLEICRAATNATAATRPLAGPEGRCEIAAECPVDHSCWNGGCTPNVELELARGARPECFQGSLGEASLSVLASTREVEAARQEAAELMERYDLAMRSCFIAEQGNIDIAETIADHNTTMTRLAKFKLAADIVGSVAAGVKDCASQMASADATTPWGALMSGSAAGFGCGAAAVESGAKIAAADLQYQMDEAERSHTANLQKLESQIANRICFNDAEMHLVGTRTQTTRIQQAMLNVSRELVELKNLKSTLAGLVAEGRAARANELDRRVSPLAVDFWVDEKVQSFRDAFRHAQRATYLAAIAVEYEYQLSVPERVQALAARTPAELQQAATGLRAQSATGLVNGASPSNDFTVISLGTELLQLAPRENWPAGWPSLTAGQRLGVWLNDPAHILPDAEGNPLGREIHFSIQPLGVLGIGDSLGIDVLTGGDCAERLWSVNASLISDAPPETPLYVGSDTTRSRIVLRKRNTFASLWCTDRGAGDLFQQASVRPSRNLFIDPYASTSGSLPLPSPSGSEIGEAENFADARINAYFNVSRAELEDESYFNGDSQELAGRGLYGDYALFIPEDRIYDPAAGRTTGLDLTKVDDILLRLDYVSVARRN